MKLKEITPPEFLCQSCAACPAVFETDDHSYVIIGKKLSPAAMEKLQHRIGADEYVIEIPRGMIDKLK